MAQDALVASDIAAAAEHGVSAAAEPAGMEERTPLTEFLFDETGAAGTWDVKVCYSDIDDYNGSGSRSKSGAHSSSSQAEWRPGSPETDDKRNTAPTVQIVTLGVRVAGIEGFEADHLKAGMEAYVRVALGRSPAVQLDARCFRDPGAEELIDHTGMHPVIISRLVAAKEFPLWAGAARGQILEAVRGRERDRLRGPVTVLVFCRSGKHRAVAAAAIIKHASITVDGLNCLPVIHLGRSRCSLRCVACEPGGNEGWDDERLLALYHGADVWAAS